MGTRQPRAIRTTSDRAGALGLSAPTGGGDRIGQLRLPDSSLEDDPAQAAPAWMLALQPMRPRAVAVPFDDPQFRFQPWFGGRRRLLIVTRSGVRFGGTPASRAAASEPGGRWPWMAELPVRVRGLPAVLDVAIVGDGDEAVACVLDLVVVDGRGLLAQPLDRRLDRLAACVDPWERALIVPTVLAEGRALHAAASARGLLGTLGRNRAGPYLAGRRSSLWRSVPAGADDAPVDGIEARTGVAAPAPAQPILTLIRQLGLDLG